MNFQRSGNDRINTITQESELINFKVQSKLKITQSKEHSLVQHLQAHSKICGETTSRNKLELLNELTLTDWKICNLYMKNAYVL